MQYLRLVRLSDNPPGDVRWLTSERRTLSSPRLRRLVVRNDPSAVPEVDGIPLCSNKSQTMAATKDVVTSQNRPCHNYDNEREGSIPCATNMPSPLNFGTQAVTTVP